MKKERKANATWRVAEFFVTQYLEQPMTGAMQMRALANAKRLLMDYSADDLIECLKAMKAGVISVFAPIQNLAGVTYGTPPFIDQWVEYRKSPPPSYLNHEVAKWEELTGQVAYSQPEETHFIPELTNG